MRRSHMEGVRAHARSFVEDLTFAWLAGDHDAVAAACAPDVQWWTPLTDDAANGPIDSSAVLHRVLEQLQGPVRVTAVVPSDDGSRCVVEMRSAGSPPAFVTSVLSLCDGRVVAGRTYTDLREHDQRPEPEAS
jgi:ketosteroid isomerase-like protein